MEAKESQNQERRQAKKSVTDYATMKLDIVAFSLSLTFLQPAVAQTRRLGSQQSSQTKKDLKEKQESVEFWSRFLQEPSSLSVRPTPSPMQQAQPSQSPIQTVQPTQSPTLTVQPTQMPSDIDRCANVTCTNPIEGCDPFDGECKLIDAVVPCIAVIDESDNFSDLVIEQKWENFRAQYPDRPFCLLRPLYDGRLYLPPAFVNDTRTIFADVSRDDLGTSSIIPGPSDWFSICGFSVYQGSDIEYIGNFIDTSGSMVLATVAESNALFLEKANNANLSIRQVDNTLEDWITPFITTLVPSS